jgi:hypothetical protein
MIYGGPNKGLDMESYFTEQNLTATGQRQAWVFQVPATGTLNRFGFLLGTVSQAPANGLKFSFQDLSSGDPDGTQDQFANVTAGITSNSWLEPTDYMGSTGLGSGTKRSVTIGDWVACVIEWVSFTAGDFLNFQFLNWGTLGGVYDSGNTYNDKYNGSAWTKDREPGIIALRYDDGTYKHIAPYWYPASALNSATFNSGSTPDERALKFQLPFTCEVSGAEVHGLTLSNNCDLVLYDSDGTTPLVTHGMVAANSVSVSNQYENGRREQFTPTTLLANTSYRLAIKPGGSNVTMYDFSVPAASYLGAVEGGTNWVLSTRTDAGAWTDATTKRPWLSLLISGVDVTSGGSGGGSYGFA